MTHLWVRAEQRPNEDRVGLTPEGAARLIAAGIELTVEHSGNRCIPIDRYAQAGASIAPENSWPAAPDDAIIFGLKELPDDGTALAHRHIMFGHAFKGQPSGQILLKRFKAGGGTLYDLEYLVDKAGRRVAEELVAETGADCVDNIVAVVAIIAAVAWVIYVITHPQRTLYHIIGYF